MHTYVTCAHIMLYKESCLLDYVLNYELDHLALTLGEQTMLSRLSSW